MKLSELKANEVPICICTKGRGGSRTIEDKNGARRIQYEAQNIGLIYNEHAISSPETLKRVFLFIEPQEVEQYLETYPLWPRENVVVLGANDQGLAYTRQTALEFLQSRNIEMAVMLDDDCNIIRFDYDDRNEKGKPKSYLCELVDAIDNVSEYLIGTPDEAEPEKIGMAGMEYVQFGWSNLHRLTTEHTYTKPEFSNFSYGDCCVWWFPMKYKEAGIKYDNLPLKCDRDFTAQVMASGMFCRRITKWQIDSPLNGKGKGGCQEWYQKEGQEKSEVMELLEKWNNEEWEFTDGFFEDKKTEEQIKDMKAYQNRKGVRAQYTYKKTSYGRSADIKFKWIRIFGYFREGFKLRPENIHLFDSSLSNWKVYSDGK